MNQPTHTWIAIRAVALLEAEGKEKNLVELLKSHVRQASVGAWVPDDADAKRGGAGSVTDNHVLKIEPYTGSQRERFTCSKADLLEHLGKHRMIYEFLDNDVYLDNAWWKTPYRGDVPKPGQHIPNRAMAMTTMMKDLLLMGSKEVDHLIPGDVRFAQYLPDGVRTEAEAAAMYFFMLSHFVADSGMPFHCDGRKIAAYSGGLHKELEEHWSGKVGTAFEKKKLKQDISDLSKAAAKADSEAILDKAREVDTEFKLDFGRVSIPDLQPKHDVWLEMMYLCRASFAVSSIIAPCKVYSYDGKVPKPTFNKLFGGANQGSLEKLDQMVMHDAVLNTAILWKHIWNKVSKEE